jgi:RHS repeat-associated protein
MLRRDLFALVALAVFSAAYPSQAQVATGTYPLGTYDTLGADTINVGNLNVMLDIPVLHKAGRAGTNFTYDLFYNGAIYTPGKITGQPWTPDQNWGWIAETQPLVGFISENSGTTECLIGSRMYPLIRTLQAVVYHDNFGVSHRFTGSQKYNGCTGSNTDTLTGTYSTDGQYYYGLNGLSNKSKAIINAPVQNYSGAGTYTDANGNKISTDGSGNFTDTTGAVVLKVSGAAPSAQTFAYTDASGTARSLVVDYGTYTIATNFGCSNATEYSAANVSLVSSITFPDGSSFTFTYEHASGTASGSVTGRLQTVTLPAGGVITYTYSGANNGINCSDGSPLGLTRVMTSATGTPTRTYTRTLSGTNSQTTVVDEVGNHHNYSFVPGIDATSSVIGMYQTAVSVTTGGSGTPLVASQTCYNGQSLPCTTQSLTIPITGVIQYNTLDGAAQNELSTTYDIYGDLTNTTTYDFGSATAPGSMLLSDARVYTGSLLTSDTLRNSSGTISTTNYTYDSNPLQTTSGIPQYTSGTNYGNLTQVSVLTNPGVNTNALTTNYVYYNTGSLYSTTSPSGGVTYSSYDSTNTHVTGLTPPAPNGVALSSSYSYDPYLGQIASATNPNGTVTSITTTDGAGHPSQLLVSNGGTTLAETTSSSYPTQSTVIKYQGSGTSAQSNTYYDNYSRPIRTAMQSDSGDWYVTDTCYDAASRVHFQSYPYKTSTLGAEVCSGLGDTYAYDALGRTLSVAHGDSPSTSVDYIYFGNSTQVTNENGIGHIYQTDGAGRPTKVCELTTTALNGVSPTSCGTLRAGTGFVTSYGYTNRSVTVTQGAQSRLFTYDGAGRLTWKQEPESNWTSYAYSSNSTGNVVAREKPTAGQTNATGAAGTYTTTTTQYDQLGRQVSVSYTDGITPTKTFTYDVAPSGSSFNVGYAKGQMTSAATSNGASTMFSYDAAGRVQNTSQCIPSWCGVSTPSAFTRSYSYDWENNPIGESYGTATGGTLASLTYAVNLAGQLTSVSGGQDHSLSSLFTATTLTPYGPTAASLGNGVAATSTYDPFGRSSGTQLTKSGTALYTYTAQWVGGRVNSSSDSVNGTASYGYDNFNRLNSATIGSSAGTMNMTWTYDQYGNRLSQSASGSYPVGIYQPSFSVSSTSNQMTSSGYAYDAAGNLMDGGGNAYTYDAEGNVLTVSGGTSATFAYDALNQRIWTTIGGVVRAYGFNASGQRATVWDGNGNLLSAQYYASGQALAYWLASDGHVRFPQQDWVQTARLRMTYTGSVEGSFTSLPFGDSTTTASGVDTDPSHYGGLDEDSQELQHATFRAYSNLQARWLRPDPYDGSYNLGDPQSLNRYSYARNNPLAATDPSGLDDTDACSDLANDCFVDNGGGPGAGASPSDPPSSVTVVGCPTGNTDPLCNGPAPTPDPIVCYVCVVAPVQAPSGPAPGGAAPNNFTKKYLPPGAQSCSAIFNFHAPPGFDLNAIIAAGRAGGANPFAALRAVGHGGTFDFQRSVSGGNTTFYSGYTDASNIAVGAYLYGAGFSNGQASFISNSFANTMSSNAGSPQQSDYRNLGYDLANAGWNPSCH